MNLRSVVDTIPEYPNEEVTFFRRNSTFTLDEAFPERKVSTTTDENGAYSIDLWPNTEGLSATSYLAVYPGKDAISFVLPAGDSPITMAELRDQVAWDWGITPTPESIDVERARYANNVNPALGDRLIGYVNSLPGAIPSTVDQKLNERVSLLDFYEPDGSTTDAEAFATGVVACVAGGRVLYIPGRLEPYDFGEVAGLVPTGDLVIVGESQETVRIVGASGQAFLSIYHNLALRDLTLDGWLYGVSLFAYSSLNVVDIERVAFKNGAYGIISTSQTFDPNNILDLFRVQNSHFENLTDGGCVMYIGFEQADVAHNTVLNCARRGIQLGRNFSTVGAAPVTVAQILEYQDKFTNMRVVDNHIRGLTNNNIDQATHNIICYGRDAICALNTVRDCVSNAATTEVSAIYLKVRRYTHVGNISSNHQIVGGTGLVRHFNIKGSKRGGDGITSPVSGQGYNSICIGNHAECNGVGAVAFRIQNGDVLLADNRAEGFTSAGILVSSGITESDPDDVDGYSNIMLANNKLWGADAAVGRTVYGVNCTSVGTNIIIDGQQINNVEIGVRVTAQQLTPRNHHVTSNKCTNLRRHGFEFDYAVALDNLFLNRNSVDTVTPATGNGYAYLFNGAGTIRNLWAWGNSATRINPIAGTATAWYLGASGTITNAYLKDNPIDDVNPVDSSSGYGYRFVGAIVNLDLTPNFITNVKTLPVFYSTEPTSWSGRRTFTASYNPPDLADNGTQYTTVSAPGSVGTDIVRVSFAETSPTGANANGIRFSADIKTAGTVTVMMENKSGASRNLNAGTLTVTVEKAV